MNLLLVKPGESSDDGLVRLTGRRLLHAREVLRVHEGSTLRVGMLGGLVGTGEVVSLSEQALVLRVALSQPPPPRAGVDLLLAMPRPKALKKILPAIASLGVGRLVLANAARVEKSFFASPVLQASAIEELLCLGLEQARDTLPPEVLVRERLRPFVEDELEALFASTPVRLLAHPGAPPLRAAIAGTRAKTLLAIGPDGGWVPFELELLSAHGFTQVSLGERALRTEVAVSALLGALAALG